MPIIADLQKLSLDDEVFLFTLSNFNPLNIYESFSFSPNLGVVFGGVQFIAVPCEITGLSYSSEGALPRPKLEVADPDGLITSLSYLYGGLEGATLEVKSTLKRYLDGQPQADSTAVRITDSYMISQRLREVPTKGLEFELSSSFDVTEDSLPGRLAINRCSWIYRSSECGWTGGMFDLNDRPTLDSRKDRCSKTITGCTKRYTKTAVLPWGGFTSGQV